MSSLVSCPVCSAKVHKSLINAHLDNNCASASSPPTSHPSSTMKPPSSSTPAGGDVIEVMDDSPVRPKVGKKGSGEGKGAKEKEKVRMAPVFEGLGKRKAVENEEDEKIVLPKPGGQKGKGKEGRDVFEDAEEKPRKQEMKETPNGTKRQKIDPVKAAQPLAERLRPQSLSTYIGQTPLIGPNSLLRKTLESLQAGGTSSGAGLGSMILWGPPGSGKTTLARLVAGIVEGDFRELSATSAGTADVRKIFEQAKNQLKLIGRKTILFIDEIHRFTKPQQDLFLPFVEQGSVMLIGATTENPSFKVNGALLSRCRVFTLSKLTPDELHTILQNALATFPDLPRLPSKLLPFLAGVADGDARQALNSLEFALSVCQRRTKLQALASPSTPPSSGAEREQEEDELMEAVKSGLRKGYDRTGEEHYDYISALHKSIRGSDGSAALYWLARMLVGGEDPLFVARRLVVVASEDVGMADAQALPLAMATFQACQVIGMPECRINLAHCVTYLSEAKKSTRAYKAYAKAEALASEPTLPTVPMNIRNKPTKLMEEMGYGKGYAYDPDYAHPVYNAFMPLEIAEKSTFGKEALLMPDGKDEKVWDEGKLRDWEWKRNGGDDWEGRS